MSTIKERISKIEVEVQEIKGLRDSRHEHATILHKHENKLVNYDNALNSIYSSVDNLTHVVTKFTNLFNKAVYMFTGAAMVGSIVLGSAGYIIYIIYQGAKVFLGME